MTAGHSILFGVFRHNFLYHLNKKWHLSCHPQSESSWIITFLAILCMCAWKVEIQTMEMFIKCVQVIIISAAFAGTYGMISIMFTF